jgi:serine/threonine-protein kinase
MQRTVEKSELVDEIGHGGMATVYRARDTRLDRAVALKIMHPHLQGAREARQRFAREALTVARLKHPSILEIYDYSGDESELSFIATELLTGPTLKQFVDQHPEIPAEIAACMTLQVARALRAAHAERVIHRDVKPENVMLHENRCLKLTDFGIAQLVDVQGMTTTGQVLGSPGHMAPEQIEGRECDARTDLFSLGTVTYLLATGELPFTGTNPHQVLKRIMEGSFLDPLQLRPSIGDTLANVIRKLLELEPKDRYQSAAELEEDLVAFLTELGIDAPDQTLAEYLRDPEVFVASFRPIILERLTTLGEQAQRAGDHPKALDCYNRVLALDESNARVLSAVRNLGRRRALRRRIVWGLSASSAVAAVVALAIFAVPLLGARKPIEPTSDSAKPAQPTPARPSAPRADVLRTTVKPSPPAVVAQKPRKTEKRADRKPRPPKLDPTEPRRVTFNPYPANVSIGINGGDPRPFGPAFHETELVPGTHRFKFVGAHDCCIDEEITIKIAPGAEPLSVTKRLRFRPAGLYVVTDTPANVTIDGGRVSGRSRSVIQVPDMESLTETHRIRISAEGHADLEQDVRLRAGQVVTVPVRMIKVGQGT